MTYEKKSSNEEIHFLAKWLLARRRGEERLEGAHGSRMQERPPRNAILQRHFPQTADVRSRWDFDSHFPAHSFGNRSKLCVVICLWAETVANNLVTNACNKIGNAFACKMDTCSLAAGTTVRRGFVCGGNAIPASRHAVSVTGGSPAVTFPAPRPSRKNFSANITND